MEQEQILEAARKYIRKLFSEDSGGHDYWHSMRVANTAKQLALQEGADPFLAELAALLHDADDIKLFPDTFSGKEHAVSFLHDHSIPDITIRMIVAIIEQIPFNGTGLSVPDSLEGKCVQDADRLDAIGAIGIARTFAYGGSHGRAIYDPDEKPRLHMTEEEYGIFINELIHAETAEVHGFEESRVFEGCMPIESMAKRGFMVPAFGPMKPVGLTDPRTGKEPFAVVQLRQDNASDTMYNLVGFQTRLKFGEQKRVFGLIPGLEHAEFARYGVMHRNTFLNSPGFLNASFEMISRENCFFAGQITGVEGYVESAGSGLVAGMTLAARLNHTEVPVFPSCTALGAMGKHVSTPNPNFQPMNCSFGLIDPLPVVPGEKRPRKKQDRYEAVAQRALACVRDIQSKTGGIS